ncbi:condensation domain-containing protein [Gordonia sp. ABSL1-1]|uniref:condensation domain-containing protein n=1 Tax=Gordonia sp. ABSL1-1 TaxID=3053923 RepID=UPI0025730B49|nr:condensation domain-containing protein [Gordonia sp. ABSL1-1]MDL9936256.1 condensation domain-containing protein [Gordonia sp. ABSL1-1]
MLNFGLIEEWNPRPGQLTSWVASLASVTSAETAVAHPVPASHQQEEYLRAAWRNESAGFRFARLCLMAFDFQTPLNAAAMTTAVNEFVRRHDSFRSWFSIADDGTIDRHLIDPEIVDMIPAEHGLLSPTEIRILVQDETPGPFSWDCFTFGTIEWEGGFTLYAAVDHLNTDGISQALTCMELMTLYVNAAFGTGAELPAAGSYVDYCARERAISRELTRESAHVQRWIDLVSANDGELPHFPLPLDTDEEGYTRSAHLTTTVFDESTAQRFEDVCRSLGANVISGIMATAGLLYAEFTGEATYFGMTPKSTRATEDERNSVGWFTSLIPVPLRVGEHTSFATLAPEAARSYAEGKELTDVSFHRVLELVRPEDGIRVRPGWTVPMVSYIDVRKLPGVEIFETANGCLFGNRGSSEEVYMWVNRFAESTTITFLYPETETAADSVRRYVERFVEVVTTVANQGDYQPALPALTS